MPRTTVRRSVQRCRRGRSGAEGAEPDFHRLASSARHAKAIAGEGWPMHQSTKIEAIYRYPVKGLSAESLASTRLTMGETIAADRLYAIENGPSGFDPAAPAYLPKQRFLMLMRNERLARLEARFDVATHALAIELEGARVACGDLRTPGGRASIDRFFGEFWPDHLPGPPHRLPGHTPRFSLVS